MDATERPAELDAIGEHDPYVDEELALLDPPGGDQVVRR